MEKMQHQKKFGNGFVPKWLIQSDAGTAGCVTNAPVTAAASFPSLCQSRVVEKLLHLFSCYPLDMHMLIVEYDFNDKYK